jgi:hypothetical protein
MTTEPNPPADCKPVRALAADYKPKSRAEARDYYSLFEPWDFPVKPRRKRRGMSLARTIRQARKAGERGPVRVELPDGTIVTSESAGAVLGTLPNTTGNELDDETPETLRKLIQ